MLAMSTQRHCTCRIFRLSFVVSLSSRLYDANGDTLCGIATVAGAGDNLFALRNKAFAAFRAECRPKSWSYVTEASDPQEFTFILRLQPLLMPFRLNFAVKTASDAWIALAEGETADSIFANINIGDFFNSRAVIRACDVLTCGERLAQHDEGGLVSDEESRPFWIEYKGGVVKVGKGGQKNAFIEWDAGAYHGPVPTQVHVGIASWKTHPGEWVFFEYCG